MFKEKLEEALSKKDNDISTFIWKGKKVNGQQTEVRMIDCTVQELQGFYKHCESMLYNGNRDNPGRYLLLEIIADQRNRCNTELFLRWLDEEKKISKYVFLITLKEFLNNNPEIDATKDTISCAVGECPREFENIPISMVLDGCQDALGYLNKQHITLTFILEQGLWFTPEEAEKMGNVDNKLEYARQQLNLKSVDNLRINPKGLSLAQMTAMVNLRSNKYSDLTTLQLETLRNRILFSLENKIQYHIRQWENREKQIKLVLKAKEA